MTDPNPLAVGTFCPTCGTRLSDVDFHGTTRQHRCPVCGDERANDDATAG